MMPAAGQASDIVEHYRLKGWHGQALAQRVKKHARLLSVLDADVSQALMRIIEPSKTGARLGGTR